MRTFVLSDIHGYYKTFLKMLEQIRFSDDDFMYVIGDVIDRGDQGIAIIKDLMQRKNVEMFLGNHELMMLNAIDYQRRKRQGLVQEDPFDDHLTPYELWTHPANGGGQTFEDFLYDAGFHKAADIRLFRELLGTFPFLLQTLPRKQNQG